MFTSLRFKDEPVLTDEHGEDDEIFRIPDDQSAGLDLSLRSAAEYGYGAAASPFPKSMLIPRADWEPMIKEMEERKTRLSDLITQADLPCKDQKRTNYCWIYAPTHCVEISRLKQNQKRVVLSAASAGSVIKDFRNVGGWGKEGLEFIVERGLVPEDQWPNATISRQYNTGDNWQLADRYRVEKWLELRPRNIEELMSCLLRRIPVAVGYNWWRHEVTLVDPVWVDGQPGGRLRNSWSMNWPSQGAGGYSILQGKKLLPDDAVCPLSTTAS